jgi:hypothetical protein
MAYIGNKPTIGNFQICDAISVVNGQAAYTMQVGSVNVIPQSANHMIVSLNGTIQKPNSSFTVSGAVITFSSNLVTNDVIDFIQILGDVLDLGVPSDATVTTVKVVDGAITSAKLASGVGGVAGITSSADATAITIDSDEKVGIGTGSPNSTLTVSGDLTVSRAGDTVKADFSNGVNANFRVVTSGAAAQIGPSTASDLVFLSSNAERMRMLAAGGLTFGGDTAAANALDDYEEGTFTPTWGGNSSVSVNSGNYGYYTKIGNVVTVHFGAILTSSSNSYYQISNAPFQSNIASGSAMGSGVEYGHTGYAYKTSMGDNSTTINVSSYQNNAVANAYFHMSLTYRTD